MFNRIRRTLRRLRKSAGGNASLLVALGMPALIGGSGLAVDTAQWYMWKREMQFAVDQAALAGAWARTQDSTKPSYQQRATQEFESNLATTADFHTDPVISLSNYAGGTENSVMVSATASKPLPFSSFMTGNAANVYVFSQASFAAGETFNSCIIAVDEDDSGAVTIGGNASLTASCGIAALSDSESAIIINGNPTVDAGWVLSAGGIDDWFHANTDDEIHENMDGLYDPFAELTPPDNPTPRTYGCVQGSESALADRSYYVETWKYTYSGSNQNNMTLVSQTKTATSATTTQTQVSVPTGTQNGTTSSSSTQTGGNSSTGSGRNRVYSRTDTVYVTYNTYSNVVTTTTQTQASLNPGTYSDIHVSCRTVFNPGIYVIDGGSLRISGQHVVTGAGVMFVLKNGAYIHINGGSEVTLTAMTTSQLQSAGVSAADSAKLAGMLVFEDPESEGTNNRNVLNGNASTVLNGTIYLPRSEVTFSGTATVTSQCLMVAAGRVTITGTADMETFCPAGMNEDTEVVSGQAKVKLVA